MNAGPCSWLSRQAGTRRFCPHTEIRTDGNQQSEPAAQSLTKPFGHYSAVAICFDHQGQPNGIRRLSTLWPSTEEADSE
jgi:hypothetical protein